MNLPLAVSALLLPSLLAVGPENSTSEPQAQSVVAFEKRVQAYADLQRKLEKDLQNLPAKAAPEAIAAHSESLAKAVQNARQSARQGDLFTEDVSKVIRAAVRSTTRGPKGNEARKEILETSAKKGTAAEPPATVPLKINTRYPQGVSLSTVPPEVLAKLPALPKELEYRFVGPHLILFSPASNLIIDYLPGALAPPATSQRPNTRK
jgi:hypothetical protein